MDTFQGSSVLGHDDDRGSEIEVMPKENGDTVHGLRVIVPDDDGSGHEIEAMSYGNSTGEGVCFGKEVMREVGSALIRLELDLARTSEKLVNMNLFMMQVAERESDFEAFASETEVFVDTTAKALEFDILAGIFDSEVKTIDKFICSLQSQIDYAHEVISSHKDSGDALSEVEDKLFDAEESIKQSREQVIDLMMQSAKFQRILPSSDINKTCEDIAILNDDDFLNTSEKLKMQTSAQQQNILRMLEKSLARELDLDQKLTDCIQALDEMKSRLCSSEREYSSLEEETASVYTRFLEADNASVILMGISKELIGRLQSCQLNINCALQRESELNNRLQDCIQAVQSMENEEVSVQELAEKNTLEALALNEKVNSLEEQLKASQIMFQENAFNVEHINELKEKIALAESRVEMAETECHSISNEKVDSLEKQLAETNVQLQQAMVAVEASEEKQNLLNTTISDMDALILELKSKVSEANARADDAEEKWITLSESNEELNEELKFLRRKLECLEVSLQQAEEMKLTIAKDIDVRANMITELVMQLAMEREHLQKQIYMLVNENRALANKLDSANNTDSKSMNCKEGENEESEVFAEHGSGSVLDGKRKTKDADTTEVKSAMKESCESSSQNSTVRDIDPRRQSKKYVVSAFLIALLAVMAVCFLQPER